MHKCDVLDFKYYLVTVTVLYFGYLPSSCLDIRVVLSVDTEEDMRFPESMRSKAEQIIQAIREQ